MKNQSSYSIVVWILLIAVLAGISAAFIYQTFTQRHPIHSVPRLPYLGEAGTFELKSSDGQTLDQSSFKDKVWVAEFIFTRCHGQCPFMVQKMKELAEDFPGFKDLRFVSVSVDPETDTPEILRMYKENHDIHSDQWLFLTGEKKTIYDLVKKQFKLGIDENGDSNEPIIHSNRFVLMDGQGMIRGYYSAVNQEDFEALKSDLKMLLLGSS